MPRPNRLALALAGALSLAVVAPARAQSPAEINLAKQTANEGLDAYHAGELEKALGLFNQARKIYPSAQILRLCGYSELGLEHWLKALEALEASLEARISPLSKEDRKDVQDQILKATSHIGTITVTTRVAGAQLAVDGGEPRPLPLDKPLRLLEGPHKLLVSAPEHLDAGQDLKVEGGKATVVVLDPPVKPPPPPPPPPLPPSTPERRGLFPHQRLVGIAAVGAGALAGIGALVTVIEAARWRSIANGNVNEHLVAYGSGCERGNFRECQFDISVTNHESSLANQLRNAAAGLGITALVLAGAGVGLVVLAPRSPRPSDSGPPPPPSGLQSLRCGPGAGTGLLCTGTF